MRATWTIKSSLRRMGSFPLLSRLVAFKMSLWRISPCDEDTLEVERSNCGVGQDVFEGER